jgi:hypothetical protein
VAPTTMDETQILVDAWPDAIIDEAHVAILAAFGPRYDSGIVVAITRLAALAFMRHQFFAALFTGGHGVQAGRIKEEVVGHPSWITRLVCLNLSTGRSC